MPQDLLTLLLNATDPQTGARLSEAEVRANVLTFIAAGHETTANCLTWSLYLLSQSPEWRSACAREAERELDSGDPATLADRLIETRAVIDEAQPPLSADQRHQPRGARAGRPRAVIEVRRGTMVVIAPYVLHRHRALWTQADVFDPEPLPARRPRERSTASPICRSAPGRASASARPSPCRRPA